MLAFYARAPSRGYCLLQLSTFNLNPLPSFPFAFSNIAAIVLSDISQVQDMLATSELIQETAQRSRLEKLVPEWQRVPLYHTFLAQRPVDTDILAALNTFPLTGKREMREGFPFLPPGQNLETLLEQ